MLAAIGVLAVLSRQTPTAPTFYSSIPAPLPMPAGDGVDPADVLAAKIAERQADAGPALITAIQACGFSIIDHNRKVIVPPLRGVGCGLALSDYEVLGMLNLRPDSPGVKFKTMSDTLIVFGKSNLLPGLHGEIIDNWRDAFKSKSPDAQFLARFMDDLSIHSPSPWSIWGPTFVMGQNVPGTGGIPAMPLTSAQSGPGRIAAIQAYSNGMMTSMGPKLSDPNLSIQDRMAAMQLIQPAQLLNAQAMSSLMSGDPKDPDFTDMRPYKDCPLSMIQYVMLMRRFYADAYVKAKPGKTLLVSLAPALPADDTDYTGTILDFGAAATSTIFGQAVATAENIGEGAAGKIDAANAIGAWARMIATFMNLQVTLDPQDLTLQRNKDRTPGSPKTINGTVKVNFPSNANPNGGRSLRIMSWGLGADISPPDDGPASGAQVTWQLDEAGGVLEHAAQFVSPGQAGDGQLKITDQTDKDGKCKIAIQATPQKTVMPADSIPYDRHGKLEVQVCLKGANLYQDTVDAMSAVITGATGDLPGMLKSVLPDMLSRTSLFSTKYFPVTIHDWTPPLYEGTFTLELKGHAEHHSGDDNEVWDVSRKAAGKIYSIFRGYCVKDTLFVEGRGGYYFEVGSLHDVAINDSLDHQFMSGDSCGGSSQPMHEGLKINGPVANINFPYALQAGQLEIDSQHANGTDSTLINAQAAWNLPCKYVHTLTDMPTQSGIQNMDIPIKFSDLMPPHPDKLHGTGVQTLDVVLGGLKGQVKATMVWELHRVAGPTG